MNYLTTIVLVYFTISIAFIIRWFYLDKIYGDIKSKRGRYDLDVKHVKTLIEDSKDLKLKKSLRGLLTLRRASNVCFFLIVITAVLLFIMGS